MCIFSYRFTFAKNNLNLTKFQLRTDINEESFNTDISTFLFIHVVFNDTKKYKMHFINLKFNAYLKQ